jgi:hypothetical protein
MRENRLTKVAKHAYHIAPQTRPTYTHPKADTTTPSVPQKRLLGDGSPYRQIATNPCKLLESCMPQPDPAHQGRKVSEYLSVQIRCDEYRELSHQSPSL